MAKNKTAGEEEIIKVNPSKLFNFKINCLRGKIFVGQNDSQLF